MKVTEQGQVTIPPQIRRKLGIMPNSEVDFVEHADRVELVKVDTSYRSRLEALRGTIKGITTEEWMQMTRGEP